MRFTVLGILLAILMVVGAVPANASSFGSTTVTISIEEGFWDRYHMVNPAKAGGDVEKIYKIKKVEVRLMAGEREFGSHTFTQESSNPRKFSLLHGVASALTVRIKSSAAEDNVLWISSHPFRYAGKDIVIKAVPASITVNYPGI